MVDGGDPLSEKILDPYVYNNPVMLIDPTGLFGEDPKKSDPDKIYDNGNIQEVVITKINPIKTLSLGDFVSNQVFGFYGDESWKNIGNICRVLW